MSEATNLERRKRWIRGWRKGRIWCWNELAENGNHDSRERNGFVVYTAVWETLQDAFQLATKIITIQFISVLPMVLFSSGVVRWKVERVLISSLYSSLHINRHSSGISDPELPMSSELRFHLCVRRAIFQRSQTESIWDMLQIVLKRQWLHWTVMLLNQCRKNIYIFRAKALDTHRWSTVTFGRDLKNGSIQIDDGLIVQGQSPVRFLDYGAWISSTRKLSRLRYPFWKLLCILVHSISGAETFPFPVCGSAGWRTFTLLRSFPFWQILPSLSLTLLQTNESFLQPSFKNQSSGRAHSLHGVEPIGALWRIDEMKGWLDS